VELAEGRSSMKQCFDCGSSAEDWKWHEYKWEDRGIVITFLFCPDCVNKSLRMAHGTRIAEQIGRAQRLFTGGVKS